MRSGFTCLLSAVALAGMAVPAQAAEQQSFAAALTYATPALVAAEGDTLRFNNLDLLAQHDLDSDQGLFGSDLIFGGESTIVGGVEQLDPGTYTFHCSLHAWMRGALTVVPAGGPEPPALPEPPEPPEQGGPPPNPVDLLPRAPAGPLGPAEWPMYGHDLANTRDGGDTGPGVTEVPALGPVWSHASADGDFTGTPVVADGTLVAGSSGGTVFALDAATGEERWSHDFDKPINASAAISDGVVYIPLVEPGSPSVAALDLASGEVLWETVTTDQPTADSYGSPAVWDGRLFIGTSGYFGEQVSEVDVQARGSVVALDIENQGAKLWQTFTVPEQHDGGAVWSTPAVDTATGLVYVGTGNAYHEPAGPMTDSMLVLEPEHGTVLHHFQSVAGDAWNGVEDWPENPDADFGASPNLFDGPDGRRLVGQGEKNGEYWALDRATMEPVWHTLTGPGSFTGGIIGSTAFDGERIYGTNVLTAQVFSLDRAGSFAWLSTDAVPVRYNATSVANGVVYASDLSGTVTAREAMTGVVLAKLPLGAPAWGGVSIAGGSVFAATGTGGSIGYVVDYRPRGG